MTKKQKQIVQCPFCDSNRLYFRRGLVSDVLISLIVPVRSYTCGSCSRSFRRYGNYFTSKQALIHIFGALAILAFINPQLLLPESWLLKEEQVETVPVEEAAEIEIIETQPENELPLLSMAIANATNSTVQLENGTVAVATSNSTANATLGNATQANATAKTILAFNGTDVSNATVAARQPEEKAKEPEKEIHGLQEGKLKSIYFKEVDGKTRISLDLGGAPLSYTSFFLKDPNRLVVDIQGKWDYFGPTVLKPENPIFSRFRIGIYDEKIRMVMDLKGQTPAPVITKTASGLDIDVK
ncbi:AMIN domain-containing protein [Desulfovibrio sp. JC010]|uniref:AMIN domain-containing protein n=1 Tax=Desulfovibrio sp. JC010 TaxID=2593641 RepID=UPI0013D8B47A|nr:AMIN domain-containing protein [Desulfovibrio sp. JC010]NDV28683.1 AMIN domain-containing protein [Desulfovibrio sp. JC010]